MVPYVCQFALIELFPVHMEMEVYVRYRWAVVLQKHGTVFDILWCRGRTGLVPGPTGPLMRHVFVCVRHFVSVHVTRWLFPLWVLTASAFSYCNCLQVSVLGVTKVFNCSWNIWQQNTQRKVTNNSHEISRRGGRTLSCFCKSVDFHKWLFSIEICFSPHVCVAFIIKRLKLFV